MVNPWYKEPWPWLFMLPIAVTIIVGMTMLRLSIVTSDGLVSDDYYKEGKAINRSLERDDAARAIGASAVAALDADTGDFRITLTAAMDQWPAGLNLKIVHPTRAGFDTEIFMRHIRDGVFQGQLTELVPGPRVLEIHPPANDWRLRTRVMWPDQARVTFRTPEGA